MRMLPFIMPVSSQCAMTGTGAVENILSSASALSTSMLPVDEPMKSFIPGTRWMSSLPKVSAFVFVAP